MKSVRSKYLSLKYQMFTPSGCKDIEIRKFEFVAKTQLIYKTLVLYGKRKSFGHFSPQELAVRDCVLLIPKVLVSWFPLYFFSNIIWASSNAILFPSIIKYSRIFFRYESPVFRRVLFNQDKIWFINLNFVRIYLNLSPS